MLRPFRPQTWQNLHRRQHQVSWCWGRGRSASSKQKGWKGSQHTWQNTSSCRPLLAHSRHTRGGPPGTEVSTLRPPISHTFSRSQSSLKSTRTRWIPSGDFCFPVQPLGKEAKGPGAEVSFSRRLRAFSCTTGCRVAFLGRLCSSGSNRGNSFSRGVRRREAGGTPGSESSESSKIS